MHSTLFELEQLIELTYPWSHDKAGCILNWFITGTQMKLSWTFLAFYQFMCLRKIRSAQQKRCNCWACAKHWFKKSKRQSTPNAGSYLLGKGTEPPLEMRSWLPAWPKAQDRSDDQLQYPWRGPHDINQLLSSLTFLIHCHQSRTNLM